MFDFDKSGTCELDEWKAFCRGSIELAEVQELLANFFMFVDINQDGFIQFDELDKALNELSEPPLTTEEKNALTKISHDPYKFSVHDMVIFSSAEILKKVVKDFLGQKFSINKDPLQVAR